MPDCFGGIDGHAVYIDTNFGFTPQRLSGNFFLFVNHTFRTSLILNLRSARHV